MDVRNKIAALYMGPCLVAALPVSVVAQGAPQSAPIASGVATILVPRHTIIPVMLDRDLRVGGAGNDQGQERKLKDLEVAQDVIVDGWIIAKKGDLVEGHVTTSKNVTKRVFSKNESQEAALDVDDVVNFCGDTIHMMFERTYVGGVRGGFLSLGSHAHDAVFDKGVILKSETDRLEKSICAEKTSQEPLPLPSDMVVSDEEFENSK